MDVIKQIIEGGAATIAKLLTGKESSRDNEIIIVHETLSPSDLHFLINALTSEGNINEAENLLFYYMQSDPSEELYKVGISFYDRLSKLTDQQLQASDYSKDEIDQGRTDLAALRPAFVVD